MEFETHKEATTRHYMPDFYEYVYNMKDHDPAYVHHVIIASRDSMDWHMQLSIDFEPVSVLLSEKQADEFRSGCTADVIKKLIDKICKIIGKPEKYGILVKRKGDINMPMFGNTLWELVHQTNCYSYFIETPLESYLKFHDFSEASRWCGNFRFHYEQVGYYLKLQGMKTGRNLYYMEEKAMSDILKKIINN